MKNQQNIARTKAIEQASKKRLLAVNPKLVEKSEICFLKKECEVCKID